MAATPLLIGAVGLAYFGLSMGVFALIDPDATGSAWWPGAGLTLGVLTLVRRRDWPLVLAAVAAADVAADLLQHAPLATSALWAASNCLEPLLGACMLNRLSRGRPLGLDSKDEVLRFLGVAVLAGPPLASLVGTVASMTTLGQPLYPTWPRWYVGDVLGILVVAPLVVYLPRLPAIPARRLVAALGLVAAAGFAAFGVLHLGEDVYLVLPALVVVAVTLGPAGAAPAAFLAAVIANVASALGHGPFALTPAEPHALAELQFFTALELITVWLLAGISSDLRRTRTRLDVLEGSFWHVTRDQEVLPICMGCARVATADGEWEKLELFFRHRTDFLSHGYCPDCAAAALVDYAGQSGATA